MPCDQRQEVAVEFGQATDLDALSDTLEALGYTGIRRSQTGQHSLGFDQGRFDGQKVVFFNDRSTSREVLARAYTKATVLKQADRFSWAAKAANAVQLATAGFSRKW